MRDRCRDPRLGPCRAYGDTLVACPGWEVCTENGSAYIGDGVSFPQCLRAGNRRLGQRRHRACRPGAGGRKLLRRRKEELFVPHGTLNRDVLGENTHCRRLPCPTPVRIGKSRSAKSDEQRTSTCRSKSILMMMIEFNQNR